MMSFASAWGKKTTACHSQAARDNNPSTTVADIHSQWNFENQQREECDFAKHKEAFVHVAVPYDWWNPFNEQPELLKQHTRDWKVCIPLRCVDVLVGLDACVHRLTVTSNAHHH